MRAIFGVEHAEVVRSAADGVIAVCVCGLALALVGPWQAKLALVGVLNAPAVYWFCRTRGWTLGRAQATLAYTAHFVHGLAVLARLLWACAGIIGLLVWMCLRLGLTLVHCLVGGNGPRISGGRRATPSLSLPRSVTHGRKRVRKPCPRWCDGGFGPCELCGGTGYRGWHTCRRCNGTKRSKCSRCHGTGEVWGYE